MSEDTSIDDAVLNAVSRVMSDNGGGMPTGAYLLIAEVFDAKGGRATYISTPNSQTTPAAMGLLAYASEYVGAEARVQIYASLHAAAEPDE